MNTTVLNLATLAATEYTGAITGLAGDFEASAAGVRRLVDGSSAEASTVSFGAQFDAQRHRPKYLYLFGTGLADFELQLSDTRGDSYTYEIQMKHDDAARFVLGGGVRDNYLHLTLTRISTEPMRVDRAEFETIGKTTRRL